jgi:hypothetical protein
MAVVPPIMRDHQNPGAAWQLMQKGLLASTRPCDRVDWELSHAKSHFCQAFGGFSILESFIPVMDKKGRELIGG